MCLNIIDTNVNPDATSVLAVLVTESDARVWVLKWEIQKMCKKGCIQCLNREWKPNERVSFDYFNQLDVGQLPPTLNSSTEVLVSKGGTGLHGYTRNLDEPASLETEVIFYGSRYGDKFIKGLFFSLSKWFESIVVHWYAKILRQLFGFSPFWYDLMHWM